MLTRTLFFLLTFLTVLFNVAAAPVNPFVFHNQTIKAGTKQQLLLPITDGKDSTVLPVTVFHGAKKGPVLGVVAGVHGYEYPPIVAVQQFAQTLDPTQLSGTVLLVHVANVPGFLGRRLNVNPLDEKNLNRIFPGKADGSITERMAWMLSNDIIARCHYFVDVHAGDANENLRPYAGYYNYFDAPKLSEQGRQMAVALGFPYVVQFGNEPTLAGQPARYCSREAIVRGIPAADIECGRLGMAEAENVTLIKQALHNLLVHLRITEGTPSTNHPYLIKQRTSVESEHTGFFYPEVKAGEFIAKGRKLGHITDLFGNPVADVVAPVQGVVLYMSSTPPVSKGQELFSIGHIE
ncbi:succinylglutamate desuccinylase/aspartoacylase family protein [Hymenobacter sp. BT507]|uniref:Succinylglutamate desuccinylase/aspartoacylase family protein n=1 Tax=Hymenobacter citatus TaxID=2763506 RepID=A0ABR7MQN4_9BACT|nr:M14 family metallopeptidase [Hymenobacter citatus]MBC6613229.1 succinylglutamate desuccinylase/aspartoacylase family protein [Hymenobacter citatus]